MTNLKKWKLVRSRLALDNPWCQVRQDEIELPDGTRIDDYFINIRPEIALVLPITPQQEIVFVRQYRHGVGEILLELPAGTFDTHKEDSLRAAQRELEEETGYITSQLIKLATLYDNPVKDTNRIHAYIALDVSPTNQQQLDITEDIEVVLIPVQEAQAKIASGEICVSGTIAAIHLGLNFLANKREK
jgi:ADP-ribose pyrophosphatase